jgi:hypothetical protein
MNRTGVKILEQAGLPHVEDKEKGTTATLTSHESKEVHGKSSASPPQSSVRVETVTSASSSTANAPAEQSSTNPVQSANITVYIEMFDEMNRFYGNSYTKLEETIQKTCPLPNNSLCIYQHTNKEVDVVYRQIQFYLNYGGGTVPYRYCDRQIVAMLNSEAEQNGFVDLLNKADIRMDHHLSSAITITEACSIPWNKDLYKTPDPSGRKGVALLMSNCGAKWRSDYIAELSTYVKIYSYGHCFHNVEEPPSRDNIAATFPEITKKHRMVVTFENTIEKDYITEKIGLAYKSGVIPVYWGPPEIYKWAPGNHSFIDPQKFKGPKELAEYLKRVDEDDDLFRYHTTNFDFERTEKMVDRYCGHTQVHFLCQVCKIAQDLKLSRLQEGLANPTTC